MAAKHTANPAAGQAVGTTAGMIAYLLPGQGVQRVNMLRNLCERVPSFHRRVRELDAVATEVTGRSFLAAFIRQESRDSDEVTVAGQGMAISMEGDAGVQAELAQSEIAQPAIVAFEIALGELFAAAGVAPRVLLGHSAGEFAAAALAGAVSAEDAVAFVARRGLLVRGHIKEQGGMVAVMAGRERVAGLLADIFGATSPLAVANVNHHLQTVLAGALTAIEQARRAFAEKRILCVPLAASHAFHTPAMRAIEPAVKILVDSIAFAMPKVEMISSVTGQRYETVEEIRRTWLKHAELPIDFVAALRTACAMGISTFVQLGPGRNLLGFARGARGDRFQSSALESDGAVYATAGAAGELPRPRGRRFVATASRAGEEHAEVLAALNALAASGDDAAALPGRAALFSAA